MTILALGILGCGNEGSTPPAVSGGGGPIDVAGLDSTDGIGGQGGASGGAGGAGGVGGSTGACDNDGDLESLSFVSGGREVAADCSISRCSNLVGDPNAYEACVTSCVEGQIPGLSEACASCYGAADRCALDSFCYLQCRVNPCTLSCTSCLTIAGCTEELGACTGIVGNDCAP
jgi:hypothetical protein